MSAWRETLKIRSISDGTMRKNQSSTMMSGIDRNVFTYATEIHDRSRLFESRITASSVPSAIPTIIAVAVMRSVTFIPVQRNGRERGIGVQSKSYITDPRRR